MAIEGVLRPKQEPEFKTKKSGGRFGNFLSVLGTVAGGVAGATSGGPLGALKGAAAGGVAGQTVGGLIDPVKEKQVRAGPSDDQRQRVPMAGAMSRRADEISSDPLESLSLAEREAKSLPERERQLILPKLSQARMLEQRKRGLV